MMRRLLIVLCLIAGAGCGRVNETYKLEVDRRAAALHTTAASYAQEDGAPAQLEVGQWVESTANAHHEHFLARR